MDEITRYLQTAPDKVDDPLGWWYERRHMFPRLSRMARDYLSIPGKSFLTLTKLGANYPLL